jgi:hypothetical protein
MSEVLDTRTCPQGQHTLTHSGADPLPQVVAANITTIQSLIQHVFHMKYRWNSIFMLVINKRKCPFTLHSPRCIREGAGWRGVLSTLEKSTIKNLNLFLLDFHFYVNYRSQWPGRLRCLWSRTTQILGPWIPIPLKAWMYIHVFCVVLSCVGKFSQMDQSPYQGVLPKCLKGFTVSEVNSKSEQARGPNP